MYYAVIDTNVIVAALMSKYQDSATVKIMNHIFDRNVAILLNYDILKEYEDVLHRKKFNFNGPAVDSLISSLKTLGIFVNGAKTDEIFIDPKDAVFYEVSLSVDESYLVTGNIRHFPKNSKVITPADFIKIIEHK